MSEQAETFTRFDIPKPIRDLMAVAVAEDVWDAADCFAAAFEFGKDWRALIESVCESAHVSRHTLAGTGAHGRIVAAADACVTYLEAQKAGA